MKVLMFGWEFPPHISGGLGTASYGMTNGLSMQSDMEITFCVPKLWGDEDTSFLNLISMNSVPIVARRELGLCERPGRPLYGPAVVL